MILGTQVTANAAVWKPDQQANEDLYVADLYAMWSEGLIPLEVWKSRPFHKDMNWLDSQS